MARGRSRSGIVEESGVTAGVWFIAPGLFRPRPTGRVNIKEERRKIAAVVGGKEG